MVAALASAQVPSHAGAQNSQGVVPSSRTDFGSLCGIQNTSAQSAMRLVRTSDGKWSAVGADRHSGSGDNMAARVWHESNWMVDLHDAPAQSMAVIHTGQMCFDGQGRITRMIDRYMEMAQCRCMRFTSLTFAADGSEIRREQKFVDEMTGNEIAGEPAAAKGLPGVWPFRRLEQLPFYSLLKK
jgi:hypothetical protein